MVYLGIDIGSSFIKAAAFEMETCRSILHTTFPSSKKLDHPNPKYFEMDAQALVDTVRELIRNVMEKTGRIDGIVLSTQMHGFVFRREGVPDRYVSWQDSRCTDRMPDGKKSWMEFLKEKIPPERMKSCGVYIKPSLGMCNLYTLLQTEHIGSASGELFTLGSYIISQLTGNNVCHLSNAAPLGLVNVPARAWDTDLQEQLGFSQIKLPQIAKSDCSVCGTYRCGGKEIPVYPDFGDQQAAILGCLAEPDDTIVNIATASQISTFSKTFEPGDYEIRPYFEGQYINTISNMPGGRNLDVLIRFVQECASRVSGSDVSIQQVWKSILDNFEQNSRDLCVDLGFYDTPDHVEGGAISHIRPENFGLTPLFSAAFTHMAHAYGKSIQTLSRGHMPRGKLVFSGGVSWKTPQLLKVVGDYTSLPYRLSSIPDEAFSGLFRIALVCSGICSSLSDHPEMVLQLN
jgi:sugar (pentulose or hexulose) kinase